MKLVSKESSNKASYRGKPSTLGKRFNAAPPGVETFLL